MPPTLRHLIAVSALFLGLVVCPSLAGAEPLQVGRVYDCWDDYPVQVETYDFSDLASQPGARVKTLSYDGHSEITLDGFTPGRTYAFHFTYRFDRQGKAADWIETSLDGQSQGRIFNWFAWEVNQEDFLDGRVVTDVYEYTPQADTVTVRHAAHHGLPWDAAHFVFMTLQVQAQGPPGFTSSPDLSAREDRRWTWTVQTDEPDVTLELREAPEGMRLDPALGVLEWTPRDEHVDAIHRVRIAATGATGETAELAFDLTVENVPPVFVRCPLALEAVEDVDLARALAASDPSVFSLAQGTGVAGSDLAVDPDTGLLTWRPLPEEAGEHLLVVEARDAHGGVGRREIPVRVARSVFVDPAGGVDASGDAIETHPQAALDRLPADLGGLDWVVRFLSEGPYRTSAGWDLAARSHGGVRVDAAPGVRPRLVSTGFHAFRVAHAGAVLRGLNLEGGVWSGIAVDRAAGVRIEDCSVRGAGRLGGVRIQASTGTELIDCMVTGSEVGVSLGPDARDTLLDHVTLAGNRTGLWVAGGSFRAEGTRLKDSIVSADGPGTLALAFEDRIPARWEDGDTLFHLTGGALFASADHPASPFADLAAWRAATPYGRTASEGVPPEDVPLPPDADTDLDGLSDADEADWQTDPGVTDTDGDGLSDAEEVASGTDPLRADTDDDGAPDGHELDQGANPTDPEFAPPSAPRVTWPQDGAVVVGPAVDVQLAAPAGAAVDLLDEQGQVIAQGTAGSDGVLTLPLDGLTPGLHAWTLRAAVDGRWSLPSGLHRVRVRSVSERVVRLSDGAAWDTVGEALADLELAPGDVLELRDPGPFVENLRARVPGVTLRAASGLRPVLTAASGAVLDMAGLTDLRVEGLEFSGQAGASVGVRLTSGAGGGNTLSDCLLQGFSGWAVLDHMGRGGNRVERCRILDSRIGIEFRFVDQPGYQDGDLVTDTLVAGTTEAGVLWNGGPSVLRRSTVVAAGGVCVDGVGPGAAVEECILDGLHAARLTGYRVDPTSIRRSDLYDGRTSWSYGVGCLYLDPRFVDRDAGDYRLDPGSPCAGAGTDEPGLDLGGAPRPDAVSGGAADLGAWEVESPPASVEVAPLDVVNTRTGAVYGSLQAALDQAASGDRIQVDSDRAYTERIQFRGSGVTLAAAPGRSPSIEGAMGPLASMAGASDCVLEGFVLDGRGEARSGVVLGSWSRETGNRLADCTLRGIRGPAVLDDRSGGGNTVERCRILDCRIGVKLMYVDAHAAGGTWTHTRGDRVSDCLIAGVTEAGLWWETNPLHVVEHVTVVTAAGVPGSTERKALYLVPSGATLRNSILDVRAGGVAAYMSDRGAVTHSLIAGPNALAGWGPGVFGGDPLFSNAAAGDYRLQRESAAVDAAGPATASLRDLDGAGRPQGLAADMGCYERSGPVLEPLVVLSLALPDGMEGLPYQAQLEAAGGEAPYQWSAELLTVGGLSLDGAGRLSGTPNGWGDFLVRVRVADAAGGSRTANLFLHVEPPPLAALSPSLPGGRVGQAYLGGLAAEGGAPPYSWSAGGLPPGLTVSGATVAGVPSLHGDYDAVFQVSDVRGSTATVAGAIHVDPAPLEVLTAALPAGQVGASYALRLDAAGGAEPYAWSAVSGLPPGLGLSGDGSLSGIPAAAGDYLPRVRVQDVLGSTAEVLLVLRVDPEPLVVLTTALPSGTAGQSYQADLAAGGGTPPYGWDLAGGGLPSGLGLDASGRLRGTPGEVGDFAAVFRVTDAAGVQAQVSLSLGVDAPPITLATTTLPRGKVGEAYDVQLAAQGGYGERVWSLEAGVLPAGLGLGAASGRVSGTPTVHADAALRFRVTDALGSTAERDLSLVVDPAELAVTTASLADGTVGQPYQATLAAAGGVPPYSWTASGLPAGLSATQAGTLSGTPQFHGDATVRLTVRDSLAAEATADLALHVDPAPMSVATTTLAAADLGRAYDQALAASGGVPPYTWTFAGGSLPQGLAVTADGRVAGTPVELGDYAPLVRATDSLGATAERSLPLTSRWQAAWRRMAPAGPAPVRTDHTLVADGDRAWAFGGLDNGVPTAGVVQLGLGAGDGAWSAFSTSAPAPAPRFDHAAVLDPQGRRMAVHGGFQAVGELDDTWLLDVDSGVWTQVGGAGPSARGGAAFCWESGRRRMLLYGGLGSDAPVFKDDLWALDLSGASPAWRQLSPGGVERPSGVVGARMVCDPVGGRALLFGGFDGSLDLNEVWELDLALSDGTWRRLSPAGTLPAGRAFHSAVYDPYGRRMLVFGGTTFNPDGDLHALQLDDGASGRWTVPVAAGSGPEGRAFHDAILDAARFRMLLSGGTAGPSELWELR